MRQQAEKPCKQRYSMGSTSVPAVRFCPGCPSWWATAVNRIKVFPPQVVSGYGVYHSNRNLINMDHYGGKLVALHCCCIASAVKKQREINTGTHPASLFLFCLGLQPMERWCCCLGRAFPLQSSQSRKSHIGKPRRSSSRWFYTLSFWQS